MARPKRKFVDKHRFAAAFADERPIEVDAPELGEGVVAVHPRVCRGTPATEGIGLSWRDVAERVMAVERAALDQTFPIGLVDDFPSDAGAFARLDI